MAENDWRSNVPPVCTNTKLEVAKFLIDDNSFLYNVDTKQLYIKTNGELTTLAKKSNYCAVSNLIDVEELFLSLEEHSTVDIYILSNISQDFNVGDSLLTDFIDGRGKSEFNFEILDKGKEETLNGQSVIKFKLYLNYIRAVGGGAGGIDWSTVKNMPNGVAGLNINKRIEQAQLPLDAIVFKGDINLSSTSPLASAKAGEMYLVTTAGSYTGISFQAGDRIFIKTPETSNSPAVVVKFSSGSVYSVNSKSGTITLVANDINYKDTLTIKDALDAYYADSTNIHTSLSNKVNNDKAGVSAALDLLDSNDATLADSDGIVVKKTGFIKTTLSKIFDYIKSKASSMKASSSSYGTVKLGSDTVQSVASNTAFAKADRTYPVQVNSSGNMVVNIPWSNIAEFAKVSVTVDNSVGTPSCTSSVSGEINNQTLTLAFHNIKGEKGDQGIQGVQGLKGDKGDKGDKGTNGTNGTNGTSVKCSVSGSTITFTTS